MLAEIGVFTTAFALLTALYAVGAALWGERRAHAGGREAFTVSARNAVILTFLLLLAGSGSLLAALYTEEYQIAYVWSVTNPQMPMFYRLTALWGSQAGSLLFWTLLMSAFSAAAVTLNWRSHRRLMPYAIIYMMAAVAFFAALVLFVENPFDRWWILPDASADLQVVKAALIPAGAEAPSAARLAETASGLNPMLRHFGMAIHPPMLYLGFVGFVIPFAFAMSALASGDLSSSWIKASRRWALIAWLFLSLGLILGGRWAYDVLGWGGYWGWDPVENAAFLPWLVGTAFLHSIMIQEKRGMLKTWNMFLVIFTFSAVIFGTFATRSGLVDSVHSFARSEIGFPMFGFWFLLTLSAVALILWRRSRGELRDERHFGGILSRESLFVLNNFVFVALTIAIFWGSFGAPIISELVMNTNITLGAEYFKSVTPPLFILMYILMGVAPLSAWGVASMPRLGRALLLPVLLTLATLALFVADGTTHLGALFGYGIVLLAGWVALIETVRGVLARQKAHREPVYVSLLSLFARNPRRYGGYLIHLGITVIGIGVIGSTLFQQETQQTLSVGESLSIDGYSLRFDELLAGQISDDGRLMDIALVTVLRDGVEIARLRPRRDFFPQTEGMNTMTIAGAHSTLENDFYVLLVEWEPINQNSATFKVYINPLINLVWWGSILLIFGTLAAGWKHEVLPARLRQEMRAEEGAAAPTGRLARKGAQ
ncbi:MAG: cytochrome c biogenesis protein CcsA [Anaerolineae bacterium]|nr:cytochrome c biogenesis protein CcsA [Anaerolineae bacterium]NUQ04922.1 heme lyase CcmF/NrfE family subunit [Anaerolineae bacterium]